MSAPPSAVGGAHINEVLSDDELRAVLTRLGPEAERDAFGLVCRRWLRIQSSERRRLRARAGPDMLRRLAARFPGVLELDLSQSPSRSFYPGVIDGDLDVIAGSFRNLHVLALQNCKGATVSSSATNIGDSVAGVSSVIESCKALEYLDVRSCPHVTRNSCEGAGLQFPSGCKVNFDGSLLESDPSAEFFSSSRTYCDILFGWRKENRSSLFRRDVETRDSPDFAR
ncbi:hypothetical protein EJB05_20628, partial [Eragrostis curvula]